MQTPHILLASSNPYKLTTHLVALLDATSIARLRQEIHENATQLALLGKEHLDFANSLPQKHWRQIVSRLYYAAYNMSRSVRLIETGAYSTDVSDHKKVGDLPSSFPNNAKYLNQLPTLRDDRNLCDYDHSTNIGELVNTLPTAKQIVEDLYTDLKAFFATKGISLP